MKKTLRKILAITVTLATLLSTTSTMALAAGADTIGDGAYTIIVRNANNTGISIEGDMFHAYQIFIADDVTSYSVTDDFRAFFTGTKSAGDGSSNTYNFTQYLDVIDAYEDVHGTDTTVGADGAAPTAGDVRDYEVALDNYNQTAGAYMDSYTSNMYALAIEMRAYINQVGAHNGGTVECKVHATATAADGEGYEYATLEGVDTGYYFIFDQDSAMDGIGISASGAFIPLTSGSEYTTYVDVKQSIPTMSKTIFHDDEDKWDIVGDSQIGDKVEFRVISTLPTNIADYIIVDTETGLNAAGDQASGVYEYVLTDTMSAGLEYNGDVAIYSDEGQTQVSNDYYGVALNEAGDGFVITFDAIKFLTDNPKSKTLYTYYSATLTKDAVVASEHDLNTAELVYSTNPSDSEHKGSTDSTVFHYTFALDVNKVDESGSGLAGAQFNLYDAEGYVIPLTKGETDTTTGVVSYYPDATAILAADTTGYITTETVTLDGDAGTVTGKFAIYGLNDQTVYSLKEEVAPNGYNTSDQFDIIFTVDYDALGTTITHFTDGSAYVNTAQDATGDWSSSSTIINRLKIYLPETGGVGTVLFQVGGGALMLGAVVMLLVSKRKKEEA